MPDANAVIIPFSQLCFLGVEIGMTHCRVVELHHLQDGGYRINYYGEFPFKHNTGADSFKKPAFLLEVREILQGAFDQYIPIAKDIHIAIPQQWTRLRIVPPDEGLPAEEKKNLVINEFGHTPEDNLAELAWSEYPQNENAILIEFPAHLNEFIADLNKNLEDHQIKRVTVSGEALYFAHCWPKDNVPQKVITAEALERSITLNCWDGETLRFAQELSVEDLPAIEEALNGFDADFQFAVRGWGEAREALDGVAVNRERVEWQAHDDIKHGKECPDLKYFYAAFEQYAVAAGAVLYVPEVLREMA